MPTDFNQRVIEEFRANAGRVGGPFEGARLVLLTTTGARSGARHTTPLGYLPDGGERILVIASAAGAPRHPGWFHNLLADPLVTVEDGVFTYEAEATVLVGAERDEVFARAVEADPGWAEYQARTSRVLPVVALRPTGGGVPGAVSPGEGLRLVHDAFRHELAAIRREIADSEAAGVGPGTGLGAQLRVNCLTFCQGLGFHHSVEDGGMFPHLERVRPDLAPTLARLRAEHERIGALLGELRRVVSAERAEPGHTLSEVDRLTVELEAHLAFEEAELIPLLDG
ncbi:nitroreductase/quinone reductase family protein [Streptomyces hainanensis]|uniref:Nitroreductase family deazaflavin-dependent oxidoreductase n=1 Tax=Streptomyces hainanensis TaxID=402648 RepID=A0A4R4SXM0_9ACTN|nr:nitroreductase/quinone reductase family protein [Streptomyces hainanensis]TDC67192.1 nitroreductase family deazaflavin-dependent oxidoreductase [Streptomyces hainanensis]